VIKINGKKLARLRADAGLEQAEVAKAFNISQAAVSQWESGIRTPTTDKLPRLAELYKCTADELLKDD
jgi:transcriptional regulator with XRE-family HTH domain